MVIWNTPSKFEIERKRIYKTANAVGGAFLLSFAMSELLAFLYSTVAAGNPEMFGSVAIWTFQIIVSTLIFTLPFIIMTVPMNVRISGVCRFGRPKKGTALPLILIGMGVTVVSNLLNNMLSTIFEILKFKEVSTNFPTDSREGWEVSVLVLLGGAILPALIEEFALRGVVLGALSRFGKSFAIIVSAALFGVMHGNLEQIPFAAVLGLYLGYATLRSGSVWVAVVIHFINNGFAFLVDLLNNQIPVSALNAISCAYTVLSLALALLALALFGRNKQMFNLEPDPDTELTTGQKLAVAAGTPCIIISLLYIFFQIVIQQIT